MRCYVGGDGVARSTCEEMLAPYRTLALRVISLAVRDLVTPGQSASERDTARRFLSGSPMLTHWCRLADIDPEFIRRRLRHMAGDSTRIVMRPQRRP